MNTQEELLHFTDLSFNANLGRLIRKEQLSENRHRFRHTLYNFEPINMANIISAINSSRQTNTGEPLGRTEPSSDNLNTQNENTSNLNNQHPTDSTSYVPTNVTNILNSLFGSAFANSHSRPSVMFSYTLNDGNNYSSASTTGSLSDIANVFPTAVSFLAGLEGNNMQFIFRRFIFDLINSGSYEDVSVPLSEDVFEQLHSTNYKDMKEEFNTSEIRCDSACVVCQEDFKEDDKVTNVKCANNHIFHTECIKPWLTQMSKKCPTCREDLSDTASVANAST